MDFRYPFCIGTEGDEFGLLFPDFPEIVSWHPIEKAHDEAWVRAQAADAFLLALQTRIAEGDEIPDPSTVEESEFEIQPSISAIMKLALYRRMQVNGISQHDLAKRIDTSDTVIARIFDLSDESTLRQLEQAVSSMGLSMIVSDDVR